MVFKDAALTPDEMPRTTPVPEPHGRMPTGVSWQPLEAAQRGAVQVAPGIAVERHVIEELQDDPLAENLMETGNVGRNA